MPVNTSLKIKFLDEKGRDVVPEKLGDVPESNTEAGLTKMAGDVFQRVFDGDEADGNKVSEVLVYGSVLEDLRIDAAKFKSTRYTP